MNKNTITIVVIGLLIAGLFFYIGSKFSITGNVVNTDSKKIINSEPKEAPLTQKNKVINEVDYEVKVNDEFTGKAIGNAEIYLDGKLVGKTSSDGKFTIPSVEFGKHNLRAEYKGKISDILNKDVSEINNNAILYIEAPKTITLTIKDSETGNPIDRENIFLKSIDGKASFSTMRTDDNGKVKFEEISPGDYTVSIESYNANPSSSIEIKSEDDVLVNLDMPNPRFRGSMSCDTTSPLLRDSWIECKVSIKNEYYRRGMDSTDTSVLVVLYTKKKGEDFKNVNRQLLNFEDIQIGKEETLPTKSFYEYSRFDEETKVIAIVYDGWKYTPEDYSKIGGIELSQDLFDKLTTNAVDWCANNIGECAEGAKTIAGIFAGGV